MISAAFGIRFIVLLFPFETSILAIFLDLIGAYERALDK